MRPSQILRGGHGPDPKHGVFLGGWGNLGSQPQKGTTTYSLAANRQAPFAGAANAAVFNTFRRTRHQIFYWLPTFAAFYYVMDWAIKKNEWYNSKEGRMTSQEAAEKASEGGAVRG